MITRVRAMPKVAPSPAAGWRIHQIAEGEDEDDAEAT